MGVRRDTYSLPLPYARVERGVMAAGALGRVCAGRRDCGGNMRGGSSGSSSLILKSITELRNLVRVYIIKTREPIYSELKGKTESSYEFLLAPF